MCFPCVLSDSRMSLVSKQERGRRKAYQCLRCLHKKGKIYIEAKYRVYNHFLKEHLGLDDVPHHCKLCLFRCLKRSDLEAHVKSFPRHATLLREKDLVDTGDMLVTNTSPYIISEKDIVPLSDAESNQHWASRRTQAEVNDLETIPLQPLSLSDGNSLIEEAVSQVFPEGIPNFDFPSPVPSVASASAVQPQPVVVQSVPVVANPIPAATVDISQQLQQLIQVLALDNRVRLTNTTGGFAQSSAVAASPLPPTVTSPPAGEGVVHPDTASTNPRKAENVVAPPSTPAQEDVFQHLAPEPSAEEEAKLCQKSDSSSSSACSSASSLEHNRLLKELKEAVDKNTKAVKEQAHMLKELATCILNMSHIISWTSSGPAGKKESVQKHQAQNRVDQRDNHQDRGHRDRDHRRDSQNYRKRREDSRDDRENYRPKHPRL